MALFKKLGNVLKLAKSASNSSLYQAIRCIPSKLHIGGLSHNTDKQASTRASNWYGRTAEAKIIKDDKTGYSKGFSFFGFRSDKEGSSALDMNGRESNVRRLKVQHASDKRDGGGYGNRCGYYSEDEEEYYGGVGSESTTYSESTPYGDSLDGGGGGSCCGGGCGGE